MAASPVTPSGDAAVREAIGKSLGRIPSGLFVLTAEHEDRRHGMLASWVQQVCFEPPMVSVAIAKGRAIMPLISESRQFALCQLGEADRVLMRKFAGGGDLNDDPFLGFELLHGKLPNLPILKNAMCYLECELACHMDVEGDHDLFIGAVKSAGLRETDNAPHVHLRDDGFHY